MIRTSHRIKVLQIASGDLWAGAEVQLYMIAKSLNGITGVDIGVVLLNHGKPEQQLIDTGIGVTVVDERRLNGLQLIWRLRKIILEIDPDIVHIHRFKENILGSIAAFKTLTSR